MDILINSKVVLQFCTFRQQAPWLLLVGSSADYPAVICVNANQRVSSHTFCCELVLPAAEPIAEELVSRAVWPAAPVVPIGCCTATVEIF